MTRRPLWALWLGHAALVLGLVVAGVAPPIAEAKTKSPVRVARAQRNTPPRFERRRPGKGERVIYRVVALNQQAGRVVVESTTDRRGRVVAIKASGSTVGVVSKAFPANNQQAVELKPGQVAPKVMLQRRDDPFAQRIARVHFASKARGVTQVEIDPLPSTSGNGEGKTQRQGRVLPPHTHDVLSAALFLSTRKLKVGRSWTLPVFSGKKLFIAHIHVVEREELWTPAFGVQSAYRLDVEVVREPQWAPKDKGNVVVIREKPGGWKRKMQLWVGEDQPRVVLRILYPLPILGTVELLLDQYEVQPGKRKLRQARKG